MRIGDVSIRNIIDRAAAYQQSDFNTRVNSQPAAAWVGFRIRGADGRGRLRTLASLTPCQVTGIISQRDGAERVEVGKRPDLAMSHRYREGRRTGGMMSQGR